MLDLIVNPAAGKGKSLSVLEKVEKTFREKGIEYSVHQTKKSGHATEIARGLSDRGARIVVLGGDGTFNEVVNGIVNFERTVVGFIPCGTGNDYVRATDIPKDTDKAIARILGGKKGYTDFIQMNGRRCLNVAGGGMDTDVLVKYAQMRAFRGKTKYYMSLFSVLSHLKFHKVRLTIDGGEPFEESVFTVCASNGKYIGGGMEISPNSSVNDGKLNVVMLKEIPKVHLPSMLIKFLSGKCLDDPYAVEYICKEAKIEVLDDGYVQADGEVLDDKVLECKLIHNTLQVFVD